MINYLKELFRNKEVRKKVLFTVFILVIYRILSSVPLPGISMDVYLNQFSNTLEANYLLSLFTGGLLDTPSIVGLGLAAYINASIVIQLLTSVIPKLEELSKEGARGKQMIDQYTRYLTLPLSFMYAIGYLVYLSKQGTGLVASDLSIQRLVFMAFILTAGSILVMWLAELISEKGIGNGSSLMIMFGILASLPALISRDFASTGVGESIQGLLRGDTSYLNSTGMVAIYLIVIGAIILIAGIVFMTESTRKVKVQYARRERGGASSRDSFLPLKLNQSGVMPIIFASALLTSPQLLVPLLQSIAQSGSAFANFLADLQANSFLFTARSTTYNLVYFLLIVAFSLFYAFVVFKPAEVAENLQKSGAFVPGIRPGKATENYLSKVLMRLTIVGAFFLGAIALVPVVAGSLLTSYSGQQFVIFTGIGGTSILIVVGVLLDTVRQINSLRATQNYERFI